MNKHWDPRFFSAWYVKNTFFQKVNDALHQLFASLIYWRNNLLYLFSHMKQV